MNAFTDNRLYPDYKVPIKDHFKPLFDAAFIAFLPFFKIENSSKEFKLQKSKQITLDEAREKDKLFEKIKATNVDIYSYDNPYPDSQMIIESGKIVPWELIRSHSGLASYSEINKALKTSIGAYSREFERLDLEEKLRNFIEEENIYIPTEGAFDTFSKINIYNAFTRINVSKIIVQDEFYEETRSLNLNTVSLSEFIGQIGGKDYYIFAEDKSLLFTIEWDSFFYLICSNHDLLDRALVESSFEGFYCSDRTYHNW